MNTNMLVEIEMTVLIAALLVTGGAFVTVILYAVSRLNHLGKALEQINHNMIELGDIMTKQADQLYDCRDKLHAGGDKTE